MSCGKLMFEFRDFHCLDFGARTTDNQAELGTSEVSVALNTCYSALSLSLTSRFSITSISASIERNASLVMIINRKLSLAIS